MDDQVDEPHHGITRALRQLSAGDAVASDELLVYLYNELRRMATRQMGRERPGHTLQPTALVHELWAKIAASSKTPTWPSRAHFFKWSSKAMGNYLCDHARHKRTAKCGGAALQIELELAELLPEVVAADPAFNAIDATLDTLDAIEELGTINDELATVVRLRVFGGFSYSDIASMLGVPDAQVDRSLRTARGWLRTRLALSAE